MLRFTVTLLFSFVLAGALAMAGVALYILPGLPDIESLRDVEMQVPLRIYSRERRLIAEFGEKRREPVRIADVPATMVNAFVAAEDDRFFQHPGVDWQGLVRAAIHLASTGEKTQGGSTITMQVARNFFLSREKSYMRKLNEIFLALKIEQELSKDEIMELYLNKIYLGQRAYGIGAAAKVYYGVEIQDLNLAQIAMIAGLPKAPSTTNPVSSPERAALRREYVLRRMLELEFISRDAYDEASIAPMSASVHGANVEVEAPYVAEMIRKQLVEQYGEEAYNAGYQVFTTINDRDQAAANQALRGALLLYDERHGFRGAEHHFEVSPNQTGHAEWDRLLQGFPVIANIYPGLVTGVADQSATVYMSGIGTVEVEWPGLEWARRHISENARGPAPKTAAEIMAVGDVIRIIEDAAGNWRLSQLPAVEGALISLDPRNGAILALVGGLDFNRSKFNRVTQALRQPGSSFKPFIYSTALDAGFTAASLINDAPVVFDDAGLEESWRPENYSGKYYGPTRLREALIHSRNLVSIRLLHAIGVPRALEHIARFGFDTNALPHNLSMALGSGAISPWRLASAYCVFANGGFKVEPYFIDRIESLRGETVFQATPAVVCADCAAPPMESLTAAETAPAPPTTAMGAVAATALADDIAYPAVTGTDHLPQPVSTGIAPRVVSPENVWIVNSMTRDVIRLGTGRKALELKRGDLSGKTGTTNDQRDAWFAGFNSDVVTITWVGFDKFEPLGGLETGGRAALPMWIDYMRVALQDSPERIPERPGGLVNVRIDPRTGGLAGANSSGAIFEVFEVGTVPAASEGLSGVEPFNVNERDNVQTDQLF